MMVSAAWSTSPVGAARSIPSGGSRFSRFEDLRQRICAELPGRELILDGEVVAIDGDGLVHFWRLMRGGVV